MQNKLDDWFLTIRQYMENVLHTPIYTGAGEFEDTENLMSMLGYTEPSVSWYDGVIISGYKGKVKFSSAWCVNQHSSEHKDFSFYVVIHDLTKTTVLNGKLKNEIEPINDYKYLISDKNFVLSDEDAPIEFRPFQEKLLQYCAYLTDNSKDGYFYVPRLYLEVEQKELKELVT